VVSSVGSGGEKRKSEMVIVAEDKIEEMLTEESSPPQKKLKLGSEKFSKLKKLVGAAENLSKPGVVTVSKYFAGGERGEVKDTGKDDMEVTDEEDSPEVKPNPALPRGRRLSTGSSGAWFKDIEQPSSLQGKFIYRAEPGGVVEEASTTGTVLKEISNSPEANEEDIERKKKRNPFAVKLKTKEFTSLPHSSPPPPSPPIPSSQLSMYSMDGASLTFSSQDLGGSQGDNSVKNIPSPTSQDDPPPVRQTPSPSSSGPRLGLSKFAFSGPKVSSVPKPAVPRSNLGPARVSGLSRGGGKGGGGLKQPSLLQMFARKCPKAQLGGGGGSS